MCVAKRSSGLCRCAHQIWQAQTKPRCLRWGCDRDGTGFSQLRQAAPGPRIKDPHKPVAAQQPTCDCTAASRCAADNHPTLGIELLGSVAKLPPKEYCGSGKDALQRTRPVFGRRRFVRLRAAVRESCAVRTRKKLHGKRQRQQRQPEVGNRRSFSHRDFCLWASGCQDACPKDTSLYTKPTRSSINDSQRDACGLTRANVSGQTNFFCAYLEVCAPTLHGTYRQR